MKKIFIRTVLLLAVLLLMCSCISTLGSTAEYTEEEAKEAMSVLMTKTVENANTRFFQKLSTYSFVPEEYSELISNQDNIPGMKNIIGNWNKSISNFLTSNKTQIENITTQTAKNTKFDNATMLVKNSNTSGSSYMEKIYQKDFKEMLRSIISTADFEELYNGVNQYNAWVENQNHRNNSNIQKLEKIDVVKQLAELIYNYYKDSIVLFEEFFRTTPDPFAEEILTKVFGIR